MEVAKEFARLLQERLKSKVEVNGNKLLLRQGSIQHLRLKEVKMGAKHVLHHLGFSQSYRVLSEQSVIRIVRLEKKKKRAEKQGLAPAPSQSLPYLFPG